MRPEIAIRIFDKCSWMTLGCMSYFYSQLLAWQKENACSPTILPLDVSPSPPSVDLSENLLSQKSPPFILANVLKCSGHAGQYILQYYDTNKKLTDQIRKDMTDIIVRYALDNNINIMPTNALSIIKQIIKTFPTETEVSTYLFMEYNFDFTA